MCDEVISSYSIRGDDEPKKQASAKLVLSQSKEAPYNDRFWCFRTDSNYNSRFKSKKGLGKFIHDSKLLKKIWIQQTLLWKRTKVQNRINKEYLCLEAIGSFSFRFFLNQKAVDVTIDFSFYYLGNNKWKQTLLRSRLYYKQ